MANFVCISTRFPGATGTFSFLEELCSYVDDAVFEYDAEKFADVVDPIVAAPSLPVCSVGCKTKAHHTKILVPQDKSYRKKTL